MVMSRSALIHAVAQRAPAKLIASLLRDYLDRYSIHAISPPIARRVGLLVQHVELLVRHVGLLLLAAPPIPNRRGIFVHRVDITLTLQGATSAPKARGQKSFTCFAAAPNTEPIDNVIQAGVARLVTSRILCMVKKNGLIVETRPLSKCCLNSIKATWKNI